MKTLTELANKYKSDKGTDVVALREAWGRGDKDEVHGYSLYYDKLFKPYQNLSIDFLEIGIADWRCPGSSLKMWYEYFPLATIYGFDNFWSEVNYNKLNPEQVKEHAKQFENDRTQIFIGDQADRKDLERFGNQHSMFTAFDIVVEDGSHFPDHQMITLAGIFPYMGIDSMYIIEDIQIPGISQGRHGYDNVDTFKTLVEFQRTGKFKSKYLTKDEEEFLSLKIKHIELLFNQEHNYIMAVIKK